MTAFAQVRRGTVDVGERTVGYRRAGTGPVVVLVGSLAHSSAPDAPLVSALGVTHTVIAVDAPGHGFSDPLPPGRDDVAAVAAALAETLTALGIDRAAVIGRHTGGGVAIELSRLDPERHPLLVIDDVPLLDPATRATWAAAYGATVAVRDDGSHLLQHWYRRRRAFVHGPWFDTTTTLDLDLTGAEVLDVAIHAAVLDQVDAGDRHAHGDRVAFAHDTVAALRATTAEVVALTPSYAALGDPGDVRPGVAVRDVPADLAARRDALVEAVAGWADASIPVSTSPEPARGRWTVQVPETRWGQVAARRFRPEPGSAGGPTARPIVLLHASPLAGESLLPLARQLAGHREVIVLDTLGNGDSDKPDPEQHPEFRLPEIADLARVALDAVAALGITSYDVFGTHTGAMIGLEMGIAEPGRIGALVLDGLPLLDQDGAVALPPGFVVDLTPRWDGGHLLAAWSTMVDVLTWYPWNQRDPAHRRPLAQPPTEVLQRRTVQMLRSGTSYAVPHAAVLRHRTTARLPLLFLPVAFCRAPADPMATYVARCVAGAVAGEVLELTTDHAVDAIRITGWLDSVASADREYA